MAVILALADLFVNPAFGYITEIMLACSNLYRVHIEMLRTFRQTEQVVRLFAVCLRLQVFMAISTDCNDNPDGVPADRNVELPIAAFNARDCIGL